MSERNICIIFLLLAIISFVGYIVGLNIDEGTYRIIDHTTFWLGLTSLCCSIWVALLASSIRNYKRINTSITALSAFLEDQIIPERENSKNDKMEERERLSLRSQISNTLCCCVYIDSEAKKILKKMEIQLAKKPCYYKDIIQSMKLAIQHANDNNN